MTGYGMCGVFIPDRVLAGWWRSQWKVSDRMWAGRCTTGCGRGQVYKCGWDHYNVLGGCLLFLSLCSSGFQDLLRFKPPSLLMLLDACGCCRATRTATSAPHMTYTAALKTTTHPKTLVQ